MKKRLEKRRHAFRGGYIFFAGIFAVGLLAVFGDKGLFDVMKLKRELSAIKSFNASIEAENKELSEKIGLLKDDKRYIEHVARTELGMIGRNEVLYMIEPAESSRTEDGPR